MSLYTYIYEDSEYCVYNRAATKLPVESLKFNSFRNKPCLLNNSIRAYYISRLRERKTQTNAICMKGRKGECNVGKLELWKE